MFALTVSSHTNRIAPVAAFEVELMADPCIGSDTIKSPVNASTTASRRADIYNVMAVGMLLIVIIQSTELT